MKSDFNYIYTSLNKLYLWVKKNGYLSWDPYDWGLSPLSKRLPYRINLLMSQINLYSPVNLRRLFGIKKGISNKEMAVFGEGYMYLYLLENDTVRRERLREDIFSVLDFLDRNKIETPNGISWPSYYFPFVRKGHILSPNQPDIIATSEVVKLYSLFYLVFCEKTIKDALNRIINELVENFTGHYDGMVYIKYYPGEENKIVFNVSGLALSAISHYLKYIVFDEKIFNLGKKLVDFLLNWQEKSGYWPYAYYPREKRYKIQTDYHQGFIIDGLLDFFPLFKDETLKKTIFRAVEFYRDKQFYDGRSYYRYPRQKYPVDIHNQAQGILTFSKMYKVFKEGKYLDFAMKIARWTIENMQAPEGYFYTHRWPFMVNKIPYMRWSQAWIMYALSYLLFAMGDYDEASYKCA